MEATKKRICHQSFPKEDLLAQNPPKLTNSNKKLIYSLSLLNYTPSGVLTYSRWREGALPRKIQKGAVDIQVAPGGYDYPPDKDPTWVQWHVNFADENLFVVYGGPLFAQDELQVTEHPILACLKEALNKAQSKNPLLLPKTKESNSATPVLIRRAERRVAVAIGPNVLEGRPQGLFGNNFMNASPEAIRRAVKILEPATTTNIIAMEAPKFGSNEYSISVLTSILSTAYSAFSSAIYESGEELHDRGITLDKPYVIIHTGHWGCGAYGGNKTVMAVLQILAAHLAGVDMLVYHAMEFVDVLKEAMEVVDCLLQEDSVSNILQKLHSKGYKWGITSGN